MSVVVAEGVVVVTADGKNITKQVAKDIDASQGKITKSGKGLGSKLFSGVLSVGTKTIGLLGGAITGLGLYGGFSRALNIQDARASLEGLGHDTESIKGIMASALASVKGTAFGLGDAATLAASAVAAGIKPGQQLTRSLSLMADAATIGKTSISDMGSMWNKAATAGKLTTEVMQQFHDRGIPVLTNVAKHYGVTNAAAQKMITEGKVSFADFEKIMENQLGGAALKGGNTARGAFANVGAALGRVFALFAAPAVEGAPGLFNGISAALDSLGTALQPVATQFGEWLVPALASAGEWVSKIDFASLAKGAGELLAASPLVAMFQALAPIFPIIADVVRMLAPIIADLASQLGGVLADTLVMVAPLLGELVTTLASTLAPILPVVANLLSALAPILMQIIEALMPLVQPVLDLVLALMPLIVVVAELVATILPPLIGLFVALMPAIMAIVDILVAVLVPAIEILAGIITWLVEYIVTPLFAIFGDAIVWLVGMFIEKFDTMKPVIDFFAQMIAVSFETIGAIFTWLYENIIKPTFDRVAVSFKWVYDTIIKPLSDLIGLSFRTIGDTISNVFGGISSFIGAAFKSVLGVIRGPINAIISLINGVIGGLNKIKVTIPDWVPLVGGNTFGINLPRLPMLARGSNNAPDAFIAGENGPELVTGARGSTVRPYSVTQDILMRGGGGDVIIEQIVIDAKNVREFNDVVDMVKALPQVARAGRGKVGT